MEACNLDLYRKVLSEQGDGCVHWLKFDERLAFFTQLATNPSRKMNRHDEVVKYVIKHFYNCMRR